MVLIIPKWFLMVLYYHQPARNTSDASTTQVLRQEMPVVIDLATLATLATLFWHLNRQNFSRPPPPDTGRQDFWELLFKCCKCCKCCKINNHAGFCPQRFVCLSVASVAGRPHHLRGSLSVRSCQSSRSWSHFCSGARFCHASRASLSGGNSQPRPSLLKGVHP
jgi:hypothetical protein